MPLNNICDHLIISPGAEEWTLVDKIGEGTYGEVYKAQHKDTGQCVAMKLLETYPSTIEEMEEFAILRDLCDHPNLPKFYGVFVKQLDDGLSQLWIAMELCSGGSVSNFVKQCLERGYRIDESIIAYIIKDVLKALNHLHKNNVIHRDVKGPNILLTNDAQVKLLDFGVSAHLKDSRDRRNTSIGTPYWMAPEVIACEQQPYEYDARCDIWSLGITVIELVDGKPPLYDQHPMRALFHTLRQPSPTVSNPAVCSENLKDFVGACLVKDFEKRPITSQLLQHPFLLQVPEDTSKLRLHIKSMLDKMEGEEVAEIPVAAVAEEVTLVKDMKDDGTDPDMPPRDLTKLEQLSEKVIVGALKDRYNRNLIYTFVGDILIAVNPFCKLNIYDAQHSARYCRALLATNPPHIFAIADQSYQAMMHMKSNQCIIINGESGAGKTESAHFLLQQMSQLGQAINRDLEQKLAHINPLVEAFGNAQTVINANSSRFGKYLELTFTATGKITGARLSEYLLEKSRVVRQASGESNFHVFYYLLDSVRAGQNAELLSLLDISADSSWRYLKQSATPAVAGERSGFDEVLKGFQVVGFSQQEIEVVMKLLAAVLLIGNIEFEEHEREHHMGSLVRNATHLAQVAGLLGITSEELHAVLTCVTIVASGETIVRSNTVLDACKVRDSIAKAIYGRLFDWIVSKINMLLSPPDVAVMLTIGILDIFGFENFEKNSFEQLCINITNEQLQFYFNQHVFSSELREYIEEGLDIVTIDFSNNQSTLDMFLSKPLGLLAILDEESNFPKATDLTLVAKFQQNIRNAHFVKYKDPGGDLLFTVNHYAEQVEYDATQFLEKNQDRLSNEVVNVLAGSQLLLVRTLFSTTVTKTGNLIYQSAGIETGGGKFALKTATNTRRAATQTLNTPTVATFFRNSLADLLTKMASGRPYFVRCIRPNVTNTSGVFDEVRVGRQLLYTGMLEAVKIRSQGFSHRIAFADFIKRYALLGLRQPVEQLPEEPSAQCRLLLERLNLRDWAIGKSKVNKEMVTGVKVFLKYYHEDELRQLSRDREHKVVRIQSCVRCVVAMFKYKRMKKAMQDGALHIQRIYRGFKGRQKVKELRRVRFLLMWAVTVLQKNYRMLQAKAERTRREMDKIISLSRSTSRNSVISQSSLDGEFEATADAIMDALPEEDDAADDVDNEAEIVRDGSVDVAQTEMDNLDAEAKLPASEQSLTEPPPAVEPTTPEAGPAAPMPESLADTQHVADDPQPIPPPNHNGTDSGAVTNGNGDIANAAVHQPVVVSNSHSRHQTSESVPISSLRELNKRVLQRRISFKGMRAENSDPHIEDENPAYVVEVHREHDKHTLVHQLALQRRQSPRSKFNRNQKIINSQQKIDVKRQQLERKQNFDYGSIGEENKVLKRQLGSDKNEPYSDVENGSYDFRGLLRKTNFDPEEQRHVKQPEVNSSPQDWRSILKPNSKKSNSILYK